MPRSPGLSNEKFEAVNQIALTKAISISKKPSTNQSRHRVSQGCGVGPMEVALGEARLSQQPASKEDHGDGKSAERRSSKP